MNFLGKFIKSSKSIYNEKTFLYQYNDNDFRIVKLQYCREKGWEDGKKKKSEVRNSTDNEEIERISLSRSKRNIRELALCNRFTHFATITVNSKYCDRFALEDCQELLRKKLKKIKRNNKDFKYLFITEKHKNGAFHFHRSHTVGQPISTQTKTDI